MSVLVILYIIILFYLLTPGVLVSFPPKSSKAVVALTHAIVFVIIYYFTHNIVGSFEEMTNDEQIDVIKQPMIKQNQIADGTHAKYVAEVNRMYLF